MTDVLSCQDAKRFFLKYLNLDVQPKKHFTVVFVDSDWVKPVAEAIESIEQTELIVIDSRKIDSQKVELEAIYDPKERYISILELTIFKVFEFAESALAFSHVGESVDITTFEFPRVDLRKEQVELILARIFAEDVNRQSSYADVFYQALDSYEGDTYNIVVDSGESQECTLIIEDDHPWMEISGPLQEGDSRFAPGAELFYSGKRFSGTLRCERGGLNILPLKSKSGVETVLHERLLALGRRLALEPIEIHVHEGRVTHCTSESTLAQDFQAFLDLNEAFTHVVEIGIGLSESASPIIYDWPATSNESVVGIHIGLGADPSDTGRFSTLLHFDFVCPHVTITANGTSIMKRGQFLR